MAVQNATFESQTVGSTLTTGGADGIAASGVTALCVASAANPMHGAKHVIITNPGATTAIMKWTPTANRLLELVIYIRFSTVPTVDFNIIRVSSADDVTSEVQVFLLATSGRIRVNSRGLTRWTAAGGLAANTWYRIGLYVDAGTSATTGALRLEYFNGDNLTAAEDSTLLGSINIADAVGSAGIVRLGKDTTNSYAGSVSYDSVQIKTGVDATQVFDPYSAGPASTQGPMSVLENSGGYTVAGGSATAAQALSDASDATVIVSAGLGPNETITLHHDELSTGAVTASYRAKIPAGSSLTELKVEALQDTTVLATDLRNGSSVPALSGTMTTFTFVVPGVTDRKKLRLRFTGNPS